MAGRNALETRWVHIAPAKRFHISDNARVSLSGNRNEAPRIGSGKGSWFSLTFKWRKATVEDQLEIAKLTLSQDERSERLGLGGELIVTRGIAGEQVLQDTTVRGIRHFVWI